MILTKNSSVKITCHFSKQRKWAISPEYTIIPIETLFAIIAIKTNTGKLIFGMNLFPDFSTDFEGIERRVVILKFERIYNKTDPDYNPNIDDDLATDEAMSALLNLAIAGYKSLIQNKGFIETRKSKQQLAAFVSENDSVVAWVESLDDLSELEREPISGPEGLYKSYEIYCNQTGEKAKDQKDFTRTIKTRYGYRQCKRRIAGKQYPFFVK